MYDVTEAGAGDADDLAELFRATGSPCFCRFWHFTGTNNEWLDRCANAPGENEREMREALRAGSGEARGVIARLAGSRSTGPSSPSGDRSVGTGSPGGGREVVGWMKVAPIELMKKAYDRRLYRGLPCFGGDRTGVLAIGCFLVHPEHRKRGVSEALVRGAILLAPAWGARALEAFPRRPREPVRDDELWTGPMSAFERNGFVEVHSFEPYPVLRREV